MPRDASPTQADAKELTCHIPVQHVLRLHQAKIRTGRSISDLVTEALAEYFDEREAE